MGLEAVKEEIIREAKGQVSLLLAEARKESLNIMKEAESKIREMEEKSEIIVKKSIDAIKKQASASGEMEIKKLVLDAKKQVVENVMKEVSKKLSGLGDRKRESYIKKLLEKANKELDAAYVVCSKTDAKFLKDTKIENAELLGGIIAENNDRTIRVDYSFDTLLEAIKESEMQNINKLLFG